jgi:uncharacterized protein YcaQ
MTEALKLTNQQARRLILARQNLWPPKQLEGKDGILQHIRSVGCIQFDPLNIVGRNPELVLQARVSGFSPQMLQDLLYQQRKLVDHWDKMMAIYPVEDWPYFGRRRKAARQHPYRSPEEIKAIVPWIRQEIEERGPLSSIDLDLDQTVDWAWGPTRLARAALEAMYWWGELIVHHKVNNRKVYDFAHRHIPAGILSAPEPNETEEEYHDWYVERRIGGVGLLWGRAGGAWLAMDNIKSPERRAAIKRLVAQRRVREVHVEGIDPAFYMRSSDLPLLEALLDAEPPAPRAAIIAPLDNLLWSRKLIGALFGFHYVWEVYKPASQREFGYYVLPVLYGDRFVARFEPGRDKANSALVIKNWWWEPGITPSDELEAELRRCFEQFLTYLDSDALRVEGPAASELAWLAP